MKVSESLPGKYTSLREETKNKSSQKKQHKKTLTSHLGQGDEDTVKRGEAERDAELRDHLFQCAVPSGWASFTKNVPDACLSLHVSKEERSHRLPRELVPLQSCQRFI